MDGRLRKGDELVELFQSFDDMLERLRQYRREEISALLEVLGNLKSAPEKGNLRESITNLEKIIDKMQLSL